MTTILYARVSTIEQTLEHQRVQAEKSGFTIDEVASRFLGRKLERAIRVDL